MNHKGSGSPQYLFFYTFCSCSRDERTFLRLKVYFNQHYCLITNLNLLGFPGECSNLLLFRIRERLLSLLIVSPVPHLLIFIIYNLQQLSTFSKIMLFYTHCHIARVNREVKAPMRLISGSFLELQQHVMMTVLFKLTAKDNRHIISIKYKKFIEILEIIHWYAITLKMKLSWALKEPTPGQSSAWASPIRISVAA